MADMLVDSTKLNACLDAEANAIRAKTGGASDIPFDFANDKGFADAIAAIPSGGGGSGYAKKTGSFVLSSDYTYAERANRTYLGNILIETGLSHIYSLIVWSEEWAAGEATANCFGLSMAFPDNPPTDTNVANACHYYSGYSIMRNGTNNLAASLAQGVFFHSMSSNISEGSFGLRCHSASFPIRAGQTIRWEACGEE